MDENYLITLAHEFNAGSESFLLQLRIKLLWDKQAFDHLTEAMRLCCKHYQQLNKQHPQMSLPARSPKRSKLSHMTFVILYS